jgi:hypothetical protein
VPRDQNQGRIQSRLVVIGAVHHHVATHGRVLHSVTQAPNCRLDGILVSVRWERGQAVAVRPPDCFTLRVLSFYE